MSTRSKLFSCNRLSLFHKHYGNVKPFLASLNTVIVQTHQYCFNSERLRLMHLPSGCFDDIQATPYKLRDPSWTPGQWSAERVCSESQDENFKMFNEAMKKISQGKFQPLKAPLTKRWKVATSNEKESCLKTAEMSCRLVCGVIAPNDADKVYEALVTATDNQGLHDILSLTTAFKNAPTRI